ncbi:hypothetical protein H2O64_02750 [Kordia sp. YSTF-M3]|uniref:ABC transporter substrate-binding protein n=1 Tax=Kordia aestuariivivens TaxID=2759037 RepID=A0ABR7Q5F5_9FLAO|nr:hypothetical protein [Kordia aestuariivivens]MBC8753574.1 hypothetical protein [Kordia aestuariivivens]
MKKFWKKMEVWHSNNNSKLSYKIIKYLILVILFAGVLASFIGNKFTLWYDETFAKEEEKYVAVIITNKSDESFTIPQEFRIGFGSNISYKSDNTDQNIKFIKDDDALSVSQAELLASKYVEDLNCVLIIGNSTSTLTEVTLNKILSTDKEKPSFILPIATADNITDKAKDQNYQGILRMMPNNEEQAITIKNFIFKKKPDNPKVLIYVDEDNLTYSENLSQQIADKTIKGKGTVVLKKNYGNSNRFINDYKLLVDNNLMPDMIIFVGISTNGSLLMEEVNNLNIKIPVVFTDGCTVESLMKKSVNNSNHYFVSAVEKYFNGNATTTYQTVGQDAKDLATAILKGTKGIITRSSVNDYVHEIRKKQTMVLDDGKSGKYSFDDKGENTEMNWKLYHYIDGELELDYEID